MEVIDTIGRALVDLDVSEGQKNWFLTADLPGGLTNTACAIRDLLETNSRHVADFSPDKVIQRFEELSQERQLRWLTREMIEECLRKYKRPTLQPIQGPMDDCGW